MSFLTDLVGSKPKVPEVKQLNLADEQAKAVQGNLRNLPQTEALVSKSNLFSEQQITDMLNRFMPGFGTTATTIAGNLADQAKGLIPKDVSDVVEQSDAAKALGGGYAGTGAHGGLVGRDLGLTSLNIMGKALTSMESWIKTAASIYEPSMMSVKSMFVTPAQTAAFDVEERNTQYQRQWLANQIEAMPAPWATDLKQFVYRALAAYSGTGVPNNPYSTPGSFGGGGVGEPGGASPSFGAQPGLGADVYGGGSEGGTMGFGGGGGFGGTSGGGGGAAGIAGLVI